MQNESRKVLVTGGAGFIGSHVAEAYLSRGDRVWIVDDLSSGHMENVPAGATFVRLDVAEPEVKELICEEGFDLINHHAAQIDVRVSVTAPLRDAQVNVLGILNVMDAACRAGTKRVVFASSGGALYGRTAALPSIETVTKAPESPYGVSKLAGEYYLNCYREVCGLEYVALRYANVYGPRQGITGEAGVVAIFAKQLMNGQPLVIYGNGEQTRDYVFVQDVVTANMKASDMILPREAGIDARAFNIGTEIATSVNGLADALENIYGFRRDRHYEAPRPGEILHSTLATAKIRKCGWTPDFCLREGIEETLRYMASARAMAGGM